MQRLLLHMSNGSRRSVKVPLLSARHRTARLFWRREHRELTLKRWKRVTSCCKLRFQQLHANERMKIECKASCMLGCKKVMSTQSRSRGISNGIFGDFWYLYPPLIMQFGIQTSWVITSIYLCIFVIHMGMEYSIKTTATRTNLPQRLSAFTVAGRSPPSNYVFLSSTMKWNIPSKQLLNSKVPVVYCVSTE